MSPVSLGAWLCPGWGRASARGGSRLSDVGRSWAFFASSGHRISRQGCGAQGFAPGLRGTGFRAGALGVAALGLEGGLAAGEGAAGDAEGVEGCLSPVLGEEAQDFESSLGIVRGHVPKRI